MASLSSSQVLDLFRRVGALLEGHFKLSSGLHSPGYLQSALVLQYPREAEALGAALAVAVRPLEPEVVMSPALGGIVIGQEVGRGARVCWGSRTWSRPADRHARRWTWPRRPVASSSAPRRSSIAAAATSGSRCPTRRSRRWCSPRINQTPVRCARPGPRRSSPARASNRRTSRSASTRVRNLKLTLAYDGTGLRSGERRGGK